MEEEKQYVYKVVRVTRDNRWLSYIVHRKTSIRLEYKLNEVTQSADGSPVFAFEELKFAQLFANRRFAILKCEYEEHERNGQSIKIPMPSLDNTKLMMKFWTMTVNDWRSMFSTQQISWKTSGLRNIPVGTVYCKWVKPIADVTKQERLFD